MEQTGIGDLKKILYDRFKGRIETDIIDMVFAGCDYKLNEASTALSNMCQVPKETVQKPDEVKPILQAAGVQYKKEGKENRTSGKTMYLLRGLPGSGKTHLANHMKQPGDVILSTDDYFNNGTRFDFRGDQLQEAHDWNLARARAAMRRDSIDNIFIDNTNTRLWEMLPYAAAAHKCGYNIRILTPRTPWAWNIKELEKRNSHGVPKRTLLKMMERFEKGVTVEKLMKNVEITNLEYQSQPFGQQMDIGQHDGVSVAARPGHLERNSQASRIVVDDDISSVTSSLEETLQEIYDQEISDKINREVDSQQSKVDVISGRKSGRSGLADVMDDETDQELGAVLARIGAHGSLDSNAVSMDPNDLKFLLECFPDYSRDVLESVYLRFHGDMQRICNEIMEQPLVKITSLDRFQIGNESSEDNLIKYDETEANSSDELNEDEVEKDQSKKKCLAKVSTANNDEGENDNFVLKLDRGFITALKNRAGGAFPSSFDEIKEEDAELPIAGHIAEEIYRHWENYYKAKRKRVTDETSTIVEKRRKQTKLDDVKSSVKNRPKAPNESYQLGAVRRTDGTSTSNDANSVNNYTSKLQGTFRPWSAVASGPPKDIRFPKPENPKWDLNRESPETRLYTMFPTVKQDTLDEILIAMSYNIDAAIATVRTSLMLTPKENNKANQAKQNIVEGRTTKSEIEKIGHLSSRTRSESPQRAGMQSDAHKNIVLVDLTDNAQPGYQSLTGTSYADYRAEAQAHAAIRKEWLQKAAKAYTEKHGHVASYCAEQARKQGVLMKEANARAAGMIFLNKNSNRGDPVSFDFHGLHCDEAVEMLEQILEQAEQFNLNHIDVVTGRGAHSKGKIAKLRSSVLNYLNGHQYRYTKLNDGCFRVYLK